MTKPASRTEFLTVPLPAKSTLFDYFDLWNWDGTLGCIHEELYVKCREAMDREASPTPASSTARASKAPKRGICIDPSGYDADKKIKGRKRHILVDTVGLLLHAAEINTSTSPRGH
jgi:putative transposase